MQKRETICAEGRTPVDLNLTVVMSLLVATLSEHVRHFFPVGLGKTPASREQSHVAYLAQHQSASQYIGAPFVEVMIKHEHMHLGTFHGFLEGSQTEFVAGCNEIPPVTDRVCIWEVSRVVTFYAPSISDRGPKQPWPYRWCRKLLDRYPRGDTGLWLQ